MIPDKKQMHLFVLHTCLLSLFIACTSTESETDLIITESETEFEIALRGKVVDSNSVPIPGVEVVLHRFDLRDTTDTAGIYELIGKGTGDSSVADDTLHFYLDNKLMKKEVISDYTDSLPSKIISQGGGADTLTDLTTIAIDNWKVGAPGYDTVTTFVKDNSFGHNDKESLKLSTKSPDTVRLHVQMDSFVTGVMADSDSISFWAFTKVTDIESLDVHIILRTNNTGDTCVYYPPLYPALGKSFDNWFQYVIPLSGDEEWWKREMSSNFTFADVFTMEIVISGGTLNGYTFWLDELYYGYKGASGAK